jgi:hypothetical protein
MTALLGLLIILGIPSAFIGWAIGACNHKLRGGEGFLLGLFLGPIGWLIVAALGASHRGLDRQAAAAVDLEDRKAKVRARRAAKAARPGS